MEVVRKSFFSISRLNLNGFKLSKHLVKGLLMPVKILQDKIHALLTTGRPRKHWPHGARKGDTDLLLSWTICAEKSQNSRCLKKFLLHILVKSRWILDYDTAFERSQYPPESTFNTYIPGMRPLVGAAFQSSEVWCAGIFQAALGEFEFLNYYKSNIEIL